MTLSVRPYNFYPVLTPVRVASNSNLAGTYFNGQTNSGVGATLTGAASGLTIDSVVLNTGDRVLLYGQTAALQNGIYVANLQGPVWVLVRSDDFHDLENMKAGMSVCAGAGSSGGGRLYILVEPLPGHVGIDPITFVEA